MSPIKARWNTAKPKYQRAIKITVQGLRITAIERALDPLTSALDPLRAFERSGRRRARDLVAAGPGPAQPVAAAREARWFQHHLVRCFLQRS